MNNIIDIVINTIRNPYDTIELFSTQLESQIINSVIDISLQEEEDNLLVPESSIVLDIDPIYLLDKECDKECYKECDVCLLSLNKYSEIFICKGCEHYFHYDCISKWIKRNQSCPICRHSIKTKTYCNKEFEQWINSKLNFKN